MKMIQRLANAVCFLGVTFVVVSHASEFIPATGVTILNQKSWLTVV